MAISVGKLSGSPRPEENGDTLDGLDSDECEAFDAFYREFVPRVAGYVRRHIHDHELIDEIVQETLLRAYRHGLHLEEGDEHWRWLATVARNLCIDQRALHRNWRESSVEEPETLDLTVYDADPEAHVVAAERQEIVARALERLTDRERRLLVLKHIEGRRVREMADLEGVHVEALKSALRRARSAFQESYAAITDRTGVASVFGPLVAGASLRLRELKTRIGAMGDQVTTLAAHATTSSGFLNTVTTAAVVGGLALGPGLGSLAQDGRGLGDGDLDSERRGELVMGDDGHAAPLTLARSTHDPGLAAPSTPDGAWLSATEAGTSPGTGADDGSDSESGGGSDGGSDDVPSDPLDAPDSIDAPTSAPDTNGDAGPDSAEEPEDAYITDVVYAPHEAHDEDGPGASTGDSGDDEDGNADQSNELTSSEGEQETTSEDEQETPKGSPGSTTASESAEDDQTDDGATPEPDPSTQEPVSEVFALGEPQGAAATGCYVDAQCAFESPDGSTPCKLQCSVLFRSGDGGATWEKLPARGLEADRILLPPRYPDDPRIFAVGRLGLMISEDRGHTFDPTALELVPQRGFRHVYTAFWPGFGVDGEDRLVIGTATQGSWVYSASRGIARPLPLPSPHLKGLRAVRDETGKPVLLALLSDAAAHTGADDPVYSVYRCDPTRCEHEFTLPEFALPRFVGGHGGGAGSVLLAQNQLGRVYRRDADRSFSKVASESPPPRRLGMADYVDANERIYSTETVGSSWNDSRENVVHASDDHGQSWVEIARSSDAQGVSTFVVLPGGRIIGSGFLAARAADPAAGMRPTVVCSEDQGRTWQSRCSAVDGA